MQLSSPLHSALCRIPGATIPESHAGHRGVLGNALTSDLAPWEDGDGDFGEVLGMTGPGLLRAMHDLDLVWQSGNLQFTWLLKLRWSGLHLSLSLKRALNLGSASFMARTKSPGAASGYSTMSASGMGTFESGSLGRCI